MSSYQGNRIGLLIVAWCVSGKRVGYTEDKKPATQPGNKQLLPSTKFTGKKLHVQNFLLFLVSKR